MFPVFRQIYSIFTPDERKKTNWLFLPMVLSAILNVMGIAFVAPFIAVVANPDSIKMHKKLEWLYQSMHFHSTHLFLLFLGFLVLFALLLGNGIGALTTWLTLRFISLRTFTLSRRLLSAYLQQPYAYFLNKNSAVLTKNILSEVDVVVLHVIQHTLEMFAKLVAMLFIFALLLAVNPLLALAISGILGGAYTIIYAIVRKRLADVSRVQAAAKEERYRITSEAFGGIKEIKLGASEHVFLDAYTKPAHQFANHEATAQIITHIPKYILEVIAFGGILLIVLYLLAMHQPFDNIMPLLALYAFAGYRIMPGLQSIFGALTSIRAHADALNLLCKDLIEQTPKTSPLIDTQPIQFTKTLSLHNIQFVYPYTERVILSNLNLTIRHGETIGIVGKTGAGKTTLIDLILGLLHPTSGEIFVDDNKITEKNIAIWQRQLGYVPQHIYLADDTVAHNIAFGIPKENIALKKVKIAAKMAVIHDFIMEELPEGYNTVIGERGVRLSGGQRQRLGIARALYHDPTLLVFDEATSALDTITETQIMNSVYALSPKKTIIVIAHRLSTLKDCHKILILGHGTIQDSGTYQELLSRNAHFQQLAKSVST